jgi:hypothetical protein
VPYPGSGFLCLCPLGKHGIYCEHGKVIVHILLFLITDHGIGLFLNSRNPYKRFYEFSN